MNTVQVLLLKIEENILNPLVALLLALAVLYFLFGVFEFIKGSSDSTDRATGGRHILWGIIGLVIMISVYGILRILTNTLGVPEIRP